MTSEHPTRPTAGTEPSSRRLGALLALARAALLWERLWPAFWPAAGVAGLFLAVVLLDLLPVLPGWLHGLVLVGFFVALGLAAARGGARVRVPTTEQARRRLELDSGLDHRPLAALEDRLAAGANDRDSALLWEVHRRRMRARLARLLVRAPRAGLAATDPYALRAAVGLLLVIGLVAGHDDWTRRLDRAFTPDLATFAAGRPVSLDVWVNPPAYTGLPPLFLDPARAGEEPLGFPLGSTLLAQVQGGQGTPSLIVGEQTTPFAAVTADAYKVSARIEAGERLRIEQDGRTLADWKLALMPDRTPSVEFLAPPGRTERAALRLDFRAEDDYGVSRVSAVIRRIDNPAAEPVELELPLPGIGLRLAEGLSFHDLTPHPWAGLAVTIRLVAEDAVGQRGESGAVRTVLPERIFNHPVARALVELRKQLTLNPDARLPVVRALGEIFDRPEHYFHDIVVALALRSAARRLIHDSSSKAIGEVQQLLWDTALHIEEGELAVAERDLREIQKALMEALARGADDDEIERLLDQLQQALDRFLEALAEQLREQLAQGAQPEPLPPDAQILQGDDLRRLIDRARELARTGAREAARDLLAQLQDLLENLRANPFAQGLDEQTRNALRMMQEMESLMRRQQELLDRSFRRAQRSDPNGGDNPEEMQQESQTDAQNQERLRRELGRMMRRLAEALGDFPRALGRAEQSMRDARDALEGGRSADAVGPQTRALDQLQQGMQAMAERLMEQLGASAPSGLGRVGVQPGSARDPLGRRPGSTGLEALEGVEIPDEMELRRAREILDDLRRRRGERRRPPLELDYIDRLLRQF
ncbi:MAG: TIGR02302 family protein [Kiloniellaceae bacterium]